jgi:ABC-2 type transport system ATP-binding protein
LKDAPPAVVARDLAKVYDGGVVGLDGLDLDVRSGEILGLVGQNGAGKSTTIGLLAGSLRPTRGTASVLGVDVARDPLGAKRLVGVLPPGDETFERLTGLEIVTLVARLHGIAADEAETRATDLLDLLELAGEARARLTGGYSTGMRRKVLIAAALVHAPRVVLLDEPLAALDPVAAAVVRRVLRELADGGRAVLVSSHALDTVERLCDRVAVVHQGRLRAEGTVAELRAAAEVGESGSLEDVFLALVGRPPGGPAPGWLT